MKQSMAHEIPEIPDDFLCPIIKEIIIEPVVNSAGQVYEKSSLEKWLKDHNTDPLTRQEIDKTLFPCFPIKKMISDFLHQNPSHITPDYLNHLLVEISQPEHCAQDWLDAIACKLNNSDDHQLITWDYNQEKQQQYTIHMARFTDQQKTVQLALTATDFLDLIQDKQSVKEYILQRVSAEKMNELMMELKQNLKGYNTDLKINIEAGFDSQAKETIVSISPQNKMQTLDTLRDTLDDLLGRKQIVKIVKESHFLAQSAILIPFSSVAPLNKALALYSSETYYDPDSSSSGLQADC